MISRIIRVIIFLFVVYLVLHYFDIYAYIDRSYIPDFLEGFVDFAQNTTPSELWGEIVSRLPSR